MTINENTLVLYFQFIVSFTLQIRTQRSRHFVAFWRAFIPKLNPLSHNLWFCLIISLPLYLSICPFVMPSILYFFQWKCCVYHLQCHQPHTSSSQWVLFISEETLSMSSFTNQRTFGSSIIFHILWLCAKAMESCAFCISLKLVIVVT